MIANKNWTVIDSPILKIRGFGPTFNADQAECSEEATS